MYKYLVYFLIFSFLGWCTEVVFHLLKCGRFINRGLATGPICPIYGVGICLASLILGRVESFFLTALFSMAILTVIEFAVGYFSDKCLGCRLWDYSSERGNIQGYVCPRFSVIWGIVCALVIRSLPRLDAPLLRLENPVAYSLSFVLLIISIADIKFSILDSKNAKSTQTTN